MKCNTSNNTIFAKRHVTNTCVNAKYIDPLPYVTRMTAKPLPSALCCITAHVYTCYCSCTFFLSSSSFASLFFCFIVLLALQNWNTRNYCYEIWTEKKTRTFWSHRDFQNYSTTRSKNLRHYFFRHVKTLRHTESFTMETRGENKSRSRTRETIFFANWEINTRT